MCRTFFRNQETDCHDFCKTGNNYRTETDGMSRVRQSVRPSVGWSVGPSQAPAQNKTTGFILTKISENIKEDVRIMPVPSDFD